MAKLWKCFVTLSSFTVQAIALRIHAQAANGTSDVRVEEQATRYVPPSFYTPTATVFSKIREFATSCHGLVRQQDAIDPTTNKSLPFVKLGHSEARKRLLLTANMHARELITGEVAFHVLDRICNQRWPEFERMLTAGEVVLYMFPIVNVAGRKLVDAGSTCLRKTVDGLDINRDGDLGWEHALNTGASPFATFEARIIRDFAQHIKPNIFIDLHSGAGPMMTVPWGSKPAYADDQTEQVRMLEKIGAQICPDCQIGNTCTEVNYKCPGILIDHMYAVQHVPLATLWEVWYDNAAEASAQFTWCQRRFNPVDHKQFDATLSQWTEAIFLTAKLFDLGHAVPKLKI